MSLLCLVWHKHGKASLSREPSSFVRDFPSGFERDLRLRPPPLAEQRGASQASAAEASSTARPAAAVPLFLCRHKGTVEEEGGVRGEAAPAPSLPHPLALVKSCLQKAVRRGLARPAVAAAAYLLAHEPRELLRRLPVVLCEDVGVFDELPELTWLMVAVQCGYTLSEEDMRFVLRLVAAAALHPQRTSPPRPQPAEAEAALARLLRPGEAAAEGMERQALLARCLALRACYGGMGGDVELLLSFAARPDLWADRVAPPSSSQPQATSLAEEWLAAARRDGAGPRAWAGPLEPTAQLEAAVDFHCSDVVPRLLRFMRTRPGAATSPTEEELKRAMWEQRSALNFRGPPPPATPPPTWWDAAGDAELSRLSRGAWAERRAAPAAAALPEGRKRKAAGGGGGARQLSILRFAGAGPAAAAEGAAAAAGA